MVLPAVSKKGKSMGNLKEYSKEINGCNMNIVVYKVENSNQSRCVSKFKYEGVEYFMMGLMEEGDFEKILKNLVFPK